MQQPGAIHLAAAALIAQLGFLIILVVGAIVLNPRNDERSRGYLLAWIIVVMALLSFGLLILSAPVVALGRSLFHDAPLPVLVFDSALTNVLVVDLGGTWLIVRLTGGSRASPFVPMLGLVPTVAIFLRQPFSVVIFCAGVIVIYTFFELLGTRFLIIFADKAVLQASEDRVATSHLIVTTLALVLVVVVAYATRPVSF